MQALVITAYKSTEQLIRLIESSNKYFLLFIHVDKKSTSVDIDKIKSKEYPNVTILNKYSVTWGASHLLAILDLLKLAVSDARVTYIHIISGQDMIVRDLSDFDGFDDSKQIFMNCMLINATPDNIKRRFECRMPALNLDIRKGWVRFLKGVIYLGQKVMHVKRKRLGDFAEIYYGLVWCSLPVSVAHYVVDYCDSHNRFMTDLMHIVIPEEFCFQTIIINSPYKDEVVPHNLQYYDWCERNGSSPAYLDETDYEKIKKSKKYFARKVDLKISHALIEQFPTQG